MADLRTLAQAVVDAGPTECIWPVNAPTSALLKSLMPEVGDEASPLYDTAKRILAALDAVDAAALSAAEAERAVKPATEVVDVPQPDPEVTAIGKCLEALLPLDPTTRRRAMWYLSERLRSVAEREQPAPVTEPTRPEPTTADRPEPHYKVGDWVRVVTGPNSSGRTTPIRVTSVTSAGYVMADGASWAAEHLAPAMDPALHETARRTVASIRSLTSQPLKVLPLPDGYMNLPGAPEWVADGSRDASPRWAAQLERLLGDAP